MIKVIFSFSVIFGFSIAFSQTQAPETEIPLPSATVRSQILTSLAAEIERLDGEALSVRKNRAVSWRSLVQNLEKEMTDASSWVEFLRVLSRLDLSYPNLHSSLKPGESALKYVPRKMKPKVTFASEWRESNHVRYVISQVAPEAGYSAELSPKEGDEVLSINGRSVESWQNENFEFCKFPLKEQCDFEMPSTFEKELLSWNRRQALTYQLKREQKVWTIPVDLQKEDKPASTSQTPFCKEETNRYSDFKLAYAGNRACIYESEKHPGTAIFRITSFSYSKTNSAEPIDSLRKEIAALFPWWVQHANWDHLIFDLIDNHGGNAPTGYYQILFQHEFQELYVAFKKIKELENPLLRKSIFWDSKGQEIWFQNTVSSGSWDRLSYGEFTQPIPMFCADQDQDCSQGLFPVASHPFKGKVSVLLNEWCVSSCDGFAYSMKENFGNRSRFYGHPQAGDTAYSRITINIHVGPSWPEGFHLEVVPLNDPSSRKALLSQTVVVTRSTTQDGSIVSGKPVALDEFVPLTLQNKKSWPNEVLKKALSRKD